jgi:dihydroflavonol-4-reductase
MGASGFVGSHVVRHLVERGDTVRVWTRPSSATRPFEEFDVEHHTGELTDDAALRAAMDGVDGVHYCIVDARPSLRDYAPLWTTNVHGLRHALDAALATTVPKFVFCSTVGTIARVPKWQLANEELPHNWAHLGGEYIKARIAAEQLVLEYVTEHGLPAVVLNVSTPFGAPDYSGTPHGGVVAAAAMGKLPFVMPGSMEFVGVQDVARAFLLAEEKGRAGERYIISERFIPWKDLIDVAASVGGVAPPTKQISARTLLIAGAIGDLKRPFSKKDPRLTKAAARLAHIQSATDHSKATRELGWEPAPTELAVKRAALFYTGKDPDLVASL